MRTWSVEVIRIKRRTARPATSRAINLGSVSNPMTSDLRATYVVVDADRHGHAIMHRRVAYDHDAVVAAGARGRPPGGAHTSPASNAASRLGIRPSDRAHRSTPCDARENAGGARMADENTSDDADLPAGNFSRVARRDAGGAPRRTGLGRAVQRLHRLLHVVTVRPHRTGRDRHARAHTGGAVVPCAPPAARSRAHGL